MKRNVICVSAMVLWCLLACTVLSQKIEEQMTVGVVLTYLEEKELGRGVVQRVLPGDCLISDENGFHLYRTEEGAGWDTGTRLQEEQVEVYEYDEERDEVEYFLDSSETRFVRYASRPVAVGELVEPCSPGVGDEDCYLVLDPGNADRLLEAWETATVTEKQEGMLLVTLNGKQPFLESQAKSELDFARDSRIYSLGDIRRFFGNFPLLAGMAAIFLGTVFLCGYSLRLVRDLQKNRRRFFTHGITGIALFGVFALLVKQIQFPSSLLPSKNILDIRYYTEEFQDILRKLEMFTADVAQETIRSFSMNMALAGVVFLGGTALIFLAIFLEKKWWDKVK